MTHGEGIFAEMSLLCSMRTQKILCPFVLEEELSFSCLC